METVTDRALRHDIHRTLLYYDIFEHPLTLNELFYLFPRELPSKRVLSEALNVLTRGNEIRSGRGFFSLSSNAGNLIDARLERKRLAGRRLRIAGAMTLLIKQFPFVRGVFLSGDLSKGVSRPESDIDYLIVTEPGRVWICRILLILFKKIFLLNNKKFFCLNYFIDSNSLALAGRNYYVATEIAHLKPLYNTLLFLKMHNANDWIKEYFPNYRTFAFRWPGSSNRRSVIQRILELPFTGPWADRLDESLMNMMKRVWSRRYPHHDGETRERIFRCTRHESSAFVGDFLDQIMRAYEKKLREYDLLRNSVLEATVQPYP